MVAYLASMSDRPMTDEQVDQVRGVVNAEIAARGTYRVHKDTVLITARATSGSR